MEIQLLFINADISASSPANWLVYHECFIFMSLFLFLEKRPSLGGSFSSFQVPTQRDPGLRLRKRSESEDRDEESKENVGSRAGGDSEKRQSSNSNGDMDIA